MTRWPDLHPGDSCLRARTEYELALDPTLRQGLKQKGDTLLRAMSGMVRKLNSAEQSFRSDERTLEQEVIA